MVSLVSVLPALDGVVDEFVEFAEGEFALGDLVELLVDLVEGRGEDLAEIDDGVELLVVGLQLKVLVVVELRAEEHLDGFVEGLHAVVVLHVVRDDAQRVRHAFVPNHVRKARRKVQLRLLLFLRGRAEHEDSGAAEEHSRVECCRIHKQLDHCVYNRAVHTAKFP
eukprot:CAMPEP_0185578140 /NCGR_PEP_ID=MMETSP0434-20130131/12134_1 /TAXON_ID=626734 ORGANISM="Favella taraikaensis, Strain Fe Narragansett Bay" /NCGR_SAMPLE_ID=MMETSP0434 /ASSEMBLY_ACC=CAM_ASM_000379 /LENGTH=165 /DNA_ID=CAMNT_0028195889 /DNA_START=130 /DNA_END=623 /DNA_ORIENTATION=-